MKSKKNIGWVILLNFVLTISVMAQDSCPELVSQALESVDLNCQGLGRNTACYGYNSVEASFVNPVPDDFFAEPSSVAPVEEMSSIRTSPLDEANDLWGVAIMSLQASMPDTLPGQNVTFILLGDTEVENAVAPEDAFVPGEGIEIVVAPNAGANVRSGPSTNFNVIGGAQKGTVLSADGLSEDSEWLRVAYLGRPGWISRELVTTEAVIDDLPVLSDQLRTPMQAFYLRTGIGQPSCAGVPDDILFVQGPDNVEIELTVNGVDVSLGSTGAFRIIEIDGKPYLEIIVFEGEFVVQGEDGEEDTVIRPGFRSVLCLGDAGSRGLDGQDNDQVVTCGASVPERIPPMEFGEDWCILEEIPSDLLFYDFQILCPEEVELIERIQQQNAQRPTSNSELEGVDCSTFALIGPFSNIAAAPTVFAWTEAPGATEYEIVFYNAQGGVAQTLRTPNTSIEVNVGQLPTGSDLAWEVRAYSSGQYACVTGRTQTITRLADPTAPLIVNSVNFAESFNCNFNPDLIWEMTLTWSGLGSGTISVNAYDSFENSYNVSFSGDSGSEFFDWSTSSSITVTISTSDGYSRTVNCIAPL